MLEQYKQAGLMEKWKPGLVGRIEAVREPPMTAGHLLDRFRRLAGFIAAWSIGAIFFLFIIGVGMRYLANRPVSWIDEAVTLLSVWSTFWTAAFVLKWPEHIAFDVLYANLTPPTQRLFLIIGMAAFILLMGAALPGMIDYTLFLWRERTDALQLRLDWVYSIFPIFFAAVLLRMAVSLKRLVSSDWRTEVDHWAGADEDSGQ